MKRARFQDVADTNYWHSGENTEHRREKESSKCQQDTLINIRKSLEKLAQAGNTEKPTSRSPGEEAKET